MRGRVDRHSGMTVDVRWRRPSSRTGLHRSIAWAALLALGVGATPAMAGLSSVGGLEQLRTLLADNPALHRVQARQNPNQRAREQALLGQLEQEIRRLTGRVEQLEFEQRTINRRVDQLIEDLDQRLRVLEGGEAGPGASVAAGQARPGERGDESGLSPEEALQELLTPPGDGTLGKVPESAVAGLPRPGPDATAEPEKRTFTAEQQYEGAVQLLQAGDYQGAQNGLELFLDMYPDHQLAANAAYWLAETHYVRQNYAAAAAAFARNYRTYGKEAPKAVDNLLKLGMSLASLGENEKACLSYDELDKAFPKTPAHIRQALSRERARSQCN